MLSFNALGLGSNVLKNFRNLELEIISKYSILQVAKYMFSNCVCDVSPCFWLMGIISMFYKDYHVSQATGCTVWQLENPPSSSRDPLWSHSTSPFQNHLEAILCGASVWGGEWRGLRLRLRPLSLLSVVCRGGVKVEGGVQDCPQYSEHQCHKWTISISQYQSISQYLNIIIRNCFVTVLLLLVLQITDTRKNDMCSDFIFFLFQY